MKEILLQLKIIFGEITRLRVESLDAQEPLESYGIDSIMVNKLNQRLYEHFGELSKTLFFEYQTLEELAKYLSTEYPEECRRWTGLDKQVEPVIAGPFTDSPSEDEFPVLLSLRPGKKPGPGSLSIRAENIESREPIAIIGMSGRYPQANNLQEYWENLKAGRDCIGEIPRERWSLENFYHPHPQEAVAQGKSYSKWGGFIEGFADFDPLFFNISPRETMNIDPQERLFIESCWEALEDAGYTRERLAANYQGRVGVFAGITRSGFNLYGPDLWRQGEKVFPHTSFSSVANRISYLLNLHGPSLPVDTMCSSSLTALHEACEHLYRGECELAIAGGVNLYLHPSSYIALCMQQMLSPDGKCRAFGQGANGFVPGEGVGCLLLKPLSRAIAEEDHIYALIRGTSINHGGKTNGYTVPNPTAQGEVIRAALNKAGVKAREVSYIEAHGTGTKLGDPIEISGLTQAFEKDTRDREFCAIGSVKSNIGHLEAAAGIAAITKVVLQMKHRKIVPHLHAKELNPYIDFARTPFAVQQELAEWRRPVITVEGKIKEYSRIAGISSFGAGGSNAHAIIEEYISPREQNPSAIMVTPQDPAIIVLSAKNAQGLQEQARRLLNASQEQEFSEADLANVAYTLQVGREAMEERLAIIVGSMQELEAKLNSFVKGQEGIKDLYRGQVKYNKETLAVFAEDQDTRNTLEKCLKQKNYGTLLELWVEGLIFDWNRLYKKNRPRRVSLPTYPFARERYWLPKLSSAPAGGYTHVVQAFSEKPEKPELNRQWIEMEELLSKLLWAQLQSMGCFAENNVVLDSIIAKTGLCPMYGRWLAESLAVLDRYNYLRRHGESYTVVHRQKSDPDSVWEEWESKKRAWLKAPDLKAFVILVETGLRALPDILTGRVSAPVILFPNSSLELVEGIYKNNPVADYFNEVLADTVASYCQKRILQDPAAGINILEIGAGTGGASAKILAKIKYYRDNIREYCYTDISKAFLLHAEKEFGADNSYLTFKIFNVENSAAGQGISQGRYDLVIAANVLHATKNIRRTVQNSQELLAEKGLLILYEMCGNTLFNHLTFGLLEGWWLYEDSELRMRGCPALLPETWQAVLEGAGFSLVIFPAKEDHELGQQIIVAAKDVLAAPLVMQGGITKTDGLREKSIVYFKKMMAETLRIPDYKIDSTVPLEKYGLDSILLSQLSGILRDIFENFNSVWFLQYPTIDALVEYLIGAHRDSLLKLLRAADREGAQDISPHTGIGVEGSSRPDLPLKQISPGQDIAIIGVSGRYPGAKNLEEFWDNLCGGKDSITEIPPERWDYSLYFAADKNKPAKTYCKWGGFLEGIEDFDPALFDILPGEAEMIHPQERLFLETVWELLEGAGYTRDSIQRQCQGKVGVYVGALYQQYYNPRMIWTKEPVLATSSCSYIANRVSYFFDFQGPSMAVDTACSSSATAIHMAWESLKNGECQLAIAGGVNLTLHPVKYLALSRAQLLGSHPNSRSFGDGDGFLPAEGVGAVLLKPLAKAVQDGDPILALLKSSAINNGGRSNGYTVPNLHAQAQLIEENLEKAGIDAGTISYVEAAAMGSALGDAIEFAALTKAFHKHTAQGQLCPIGSVKSNIGHAEIASGISQLTKVILQLQHQQLVPSIKATPLNPNINFTDAPFYLQQELQDWQRPVINKEGGKKEFPRRATVSSFGGGGSNVHLIVEEYIPPSRGEETSPCAAALPQIAVFSAKNQDRLVAVLGQFLEYWGKNPNIALRDLAYTLQVGREAMEYRMAMVVKTGEELGFGLQEYLKMMKEGSEEKSSLPMFTGNTAEENPALTRLISGKRGERIIKELLEEKDLEKIALYWTQGLKIPWESLHEGQKANRISLPTYPFARQRCWIEPLPGDREKGNGGRRSVVDKVKLSLQRIFNQSEKERGW